ncbi:hypothetical protein AURDEDRAFT_187017 [Auricularia subglabra TFB-10046 SS5]|nr:hypothetical protein AURDEDRAFT_187017 [Auricularia subglabra TFB-10046 SS5]
MKDPRLLPFFIIGAVASGALILLYSPVYLVELLSTLSFHGLCRLQDILSETWRRLKYGRTNARNRAAQLPQEVQLQIFLLLRARARFGSAERLMDEWKPASPGAFSGCRDLAAVRLVCRAWTDAATEVLYADVTLVNARACVAFARGLLVRPRRAVLVRHIVFPEVSRRLSNHTAQPSVWSQSIYGSPGVRRMDLKAAIDRLVLQCSRATDVTFFRDAADYTGVPGLIQCAERLTHVSLRHLDNAGQYFTTFSTDALSQFPRLQSLTLQRHRLELSEATFAFATLHTLRLGRCSMFLGVLHGWLAQLPSLRVIFWRESAAHDAGSISLADLFAPRRHALVECTLITRDSTHRIELRDLDVFSSLRRFTVSAWMLPGLHALPPSLVELIVTTSPTHSVVWRTPRQRRQILLDMAQCVVRLHRCSPWLRSVQLWDTIVLSYFEVWCVIAYLLREMLQPAGVEVAVNLILDRNEEENVRAKLWKDNRKRRLLWQDVI